MDTLKAATSPGPAPHAALDGVSHAALERGSPAPLGARPDAGGVNFAVYSERAERIELCLFDAGGRHELRRSDLPGRSGNVWHGYLPGAGAGLVYGYRAHGPYRPREGLRFNPAKLLLDPYARGVCGALAWRDEVFGYSIHDASADLSFDGQDSAGAVPKARVVARLEALEAPEASDAPPRPRVPPRDTVLYELHVRGFTMRHREVPAALRGTFGALACDPVIRHFKRLGVTTLQLMPLHFFVSERRLAGRGLANYWGYNPLAFFCPHPAYGSGGDPRAELRRAVRALHQAGLEVIVDVVFNHTAETDELGPTLSLRGLDNAVYYRLQRDDPRRYDNFSGCGNTLNLAHPAARALVIDALRYWAAEFEIDGFRFDLASALARGPQGIDPSGGLIAEITADPVLAGLKLIAEPWDCGTDGHQLGRFPPGWLEWNDGFRDAMRSFWLRRDGRRDEFARRLTASAQVFRGAGGAGQGPRSPSASVNYVTAHDGFTLADLLRYEHRRNEANGEDNRDGAAHNLGWNCGAEGPAADARIERTRALLARALLATTMLAQGTPMLCAGDEFGRTQRGNNNAYCQDNELSWVDWANADVALASYVGLLATLRRTAPPLDPGHWYESAADPAAEPALRWLRPDGEPMSVDDWHDRGGGAPSSGSAHSGNGALGVRSSHPASPGRDRLLLVNPAPAAVRFTLPAGRWQLLLDSTTGAAEPGEGAIRRGEFVVHEHSIVLMQQANRGAGDDA